MGVTRFARAAAMWFGLSALSGLAWAGVKLDVFVVDQHRLAVPGVRVRLMPAARPAAFAETGESGHVAFPDLEAGRYLVSLAMPGFEPVERALDLAEGGTADLSLELTLVPVQTRTSIEVKDASDPIAQGASAPATVSAKIARELPNRPATVADALPLIPGVVREPGGGLRISDSAEHRSALIVNSADVTDPATGQFGLTVPIDSVMSMNVFQTPFLAEYGRFSAGLVSVETRRGGEKWKWELNDPLPEFRIRSYQLRGLKTATPRVNFEGPILPGKLYLSEGFEYEIRKTAVYTLPFPDNQKKQEGINSFSQLDWLATSKQLVTATLHLAPQRLGFVNIDYFNPQETSPDAATRNYTGTLAHRYDLAGGLLENTFSVTVFDARVWAQGPNDLIVTPTGNRGNYFADKDRTASRLSGLSTYSFAPLPRLGTHHFKLGSYVAGTNEDGQIQEHPIQILNALGDLTERIDFTRHRDFEISDVELNFFAQDHWIVSPHLSLDLGTRVESQEISRAYRAAPRAGLAWNPLPARGTTVRAGFGFFYDRVPLNVYAFNRYPDRVITMYDSAGEIEAGPFLFLNTLGQVKVRHPFLYQKPVDGNFSPRSATWTVQIEQPVAHFLKLRAAYLQSLSDGLVVLDTVAPDPETNTGAYLLSGTGNARYRQFEATARVRLGAERELLFSYVRSKGRGDLSDFGNFLGTFPVSMIRPNYYGNLPADLPNRFLAWGLVQLPAKFRIAPVVEYRSGFPYIATDAAQNYAGIPNDRRFPHFLSVDSRLSKDVQVNPKYAVRVSVSSFNLTNHFNPEAFHGNVADPAYGLFFGHRGRRFTLDFDFLF